MLRPRSIPDRRLACQRIARPARTPAETVAWLGAVQAQDYLASLWAVGMRTLRATEATVEQAIAEGSIVRTHVFRGTLQYVARDDLRWMLGLVADRVLAGTASHVRKLGLDEPTLRRAEDVLREATRGAQLTRKEIAAALERAGIATRGRLIHIIARAELAAVICSGARRGKQTTFASCDERVPPAPARTRDEALAELARRYLQSRGPATLRDFVWWSGLAVRDARAAIAAIERELDAVEQDGVTYWSADRRCSSSAGAAGAAGAARAHLVPAFDEYLVGYRQRSDVLDPRHVRAINAGGGLLAPCVVVDGRVVGTWRRTLDGERVALELALLGPLARSARAAVGEAAERYADFVARPLARVTTTTAPPGRVARVPGGTSPRDRRRESRPKPQR